MKKRITLLGWLGILLFSYAQAGSTLMPKIIGGSQAPNNAWPWMAAIVYSNTNNSFCGGTLIASNWVLTAAHCMFDESSFGSGYYTPTKSTDFEILINRPQLRSNTGERISVSQIIIHPEFDIKSLSNDIALLRLTFPSTTVPIETLPDFSDLDENGQDNALALGWGSISATRTVLPDRLQQVSLPIISNELCRTALTGILDSMLCAGLADGGMDTCFGDSGGPLIVFDRERNLWRQAGITSFGEADCAAKGFYGVYTRLDNFKTFITDTICTANQIPPTPWLSLSVNGETVTANWTLSNKATGYRLNYAPFPAMYPIQSAELNLSGSLSVTLPSNSAYYVAINAYNANCRSGFSQIEHFSIP